MREEGKVKKGNLTSAPPVTTLMMPGGTPLSSAIFAKRIVVAGVLGAGLSTTALPAAMAGPI